MKGEHAAGKGSCPRPVDYTAYDNSVLWANIDKEKLARAQKEGRIVILEGGRNCGKTQAIRELSEQIKEHGIEVLEVRRR